MATRGRCELSTLLTRSRQNREMEKMRLVEETLDGLIKLCARQLFDTTDHPDNAAYPFTKGEVGGVRGWSQWEETGYGTSKKSQKAGPAGGVSGWNRSTTCCNYLDYGCYCVRPCTYRKRQGFVVQQDYIQSQWEATFCVKPCRATMSRSTLGFRVASLDA